MSKAISTEGVLALGLRLEGCEQDEWRQCKLCPHTTGAEIITYTFFGVPYYMYGKMGPKTLF